MTQLTETVDAEDEVWTIDTMPSSPYLQVEDELVEIRARYPEHIYQPTQELIAPKIRVRRAFAGTTAASHADTTTLTPAYGASAGGGGAIAVTDGTTTVSDVTSLTVPKATDEGGGAARILPESWSIGAAGELAIVGDDPLNTLLTIQPAAGAADEGTITFGIKEQGGGGGNFIFNVDGSGFCVIKLIVGGAFRVASAAGPTMLRINDDSKIGFFGKTPAAQPSANADTSGATLLQLETEVNELKAALRALGLIAT